MIIFLMICFFFIFVGVVGIVFGWSFGCFYEWIWYIIVGLSIVVVGFVVVVVIFNIVVCYVVCFIFVMGVYFVNFVIIGWVLFMLF